MSCIARSFDWDPDEGVVNPSRPLAGVGACQAHPNSSVSFSDEPDELGDSSGFS